MLASGVIISEFMASNVASHADDDGRFTDWIELQNTTAATVNLNGYFLTDDEDNLDKWQIPNVSIPAGGHLLVYASGLDQRNPSAALHANFKLESDGEYLALVAPDRTTIEHEYEPEYPAQYEDVSHGTGPSLTEDALVLTGASGKFLVPSAPVAGWQAVGFNDGSWNSVTNGVGYQNAVGGPVEGPVGYWTFDDTPNDASGNNHHASLIGAGVTYNADVPAAIGSGKSLSLSGASQQYVVINPMDISETGLTISMWFKTSATSRGLFSAAQGNLGLAGNDRNLFLTGSNIAAQLKGGVTAESIASTGKNYADGAWHHLAYVFQQGQTSQRIYIDGIHVASGSQSASLLTGQDRIYIGMSPPGLTDWWNGQIDDVAIWNQAIAPTAVVALWDGTSPNELTSYQQDTATNVDALMHGINSTAYLRMPFNVTNLAQFDSLQFRVKYDDGFVAYLNGTEIARRNAPASPTWSSQATDRHANTLATDFEVIDVSAHLSALQAGPNVLAIQGLNISASDGDFLLVAELVDQDIEQGVVQFYATPTPGAANNFSRVDFPADPVFSADTSVITGPTTVTLSTTTPGAQIYYTTNGQVPTTAGLLYTGPISVTNTTRIRARAFHSELAPSRIVSEFYTLAAADVLGFSSNLPLIVVNTHGATMGQNDDDPPTQVTAHFLKQDGSRTTVTGLQELAVRAGMSIRGQSSAGLAKKQYTFETWTETNLDKGYSILGMPEESDWIIYGPYLEKALIHQALAYDISDELGDYAPRTQYVEMFINSDGQLTASDYAGLYIFMEKIKRDENRVDIDPLGPAENSGEDVTGGYIFSFDKDDPGVIDSVQTPRYRFHLVEPNYFQATEAQRNYLSEYLTQFETALYGQNFTNPVTGYNAYIDAQSFVDNILMVEMAKNVDGYRISSYFEKDRNGKLRMGPNWDYDLAFSNANYLTGWDPERWYKDLVGDASKPYIGRLLQDSNFAQLLIDSYFDYRDDIWSVEHLHEKIDSHVAQIYEAEVRDHTRWPLLGTYHWPNIYFGIGDTPHGTAANNHPARTYRDEVQVVRQWLHDRLLWMDSQFLAKPTFSHAGGNVPAGTQVIITNNGSGTVYYTLDGSDPRLPGGGLNPAAVAYTGPITINANAHLKARLKNNTVTASLEDDWSAPTSAIYVVDAPDLILSEIMFDPAPPEAGSPYTPQDFEYIEVQNVGTTPLNLAGYKFTDGIQFTFPNATLNPGQRGVVAHNTAAFATRYPGVTPIGQFQGQLSDDGETLVLVDNIGVTLFDDAYNASWHPHTDEEGFSLVTTYTSPGGGALYNNGNPELKWRASQFTGGNPGAADNGTQLGSVVINEVFSAGGDWIELFNSTAGDIDLSGWYVSDSRGDRTKYQISAGNSIPAGGFFVLTASGHFGGAFGLSKNGETVYLSSPGTGGQAGGYRVDETFGAIDINRSFGRYVKSNGRTDFALTSGNTQGSINAPPEVGPVVITEIMYNPQQNVLWLPPQSGAAIRDEFIEIQNISASPVSLFDPLNPNNTWGITDGVRFTFPTGQSLDAGERALIVPIDPAAFRSKYSIPAAVKIYGPWIGTLDDGGEHIELSRPGEPDGQDVPEIRVDRIAYDDNAPWPERADGQGPSLSRVDVNAYGNDPANWQASHAGGTPGAPNTFIDSTPPGQVENVFFSKSGVGTQDPRTNVSWNVVIDAETGAVAYYNIYRIGSDTDPARAKPFLVGRSTTASFVDNTVFQHFDFRYQISAVNVDGIEGPRSDLALVVPLAVNDDYSVGEDNALVTTSGPEGVDTLIPAGSVWKYLVTGSDPGPTWNDETINESGWSQGPAELGFNTDNTEPLEATVIPFIDVDPISGVQKNWTTYFRHTFTVNNPAYASMVLKLKRDDGAAVWVNGVERIRSGLPGSPGDAPTAFNFYSAAVGDDGAVFNEIPFDPAWLHAGSNTIAVEVHQGGAASSDLSFDLALEAVRPRRSGLLANDDSQGFSPMTAVKLSDPVNGQITQFNPDGTFTYVPNPNFFGTDSFTYKAVGANGNSSLPATVTIDVLPINDAVAGRHVFYNQSKFDGNDAGANAADDAAIATDKLALLPGGTASFENYTSYNRGLNGIMVDLTSASGSITAGDFEFKVGNSDTPGTWAALAAAPVVTIRDGAGVAGSDRVTFVWNSGAAIKQWLQITVKANARTGLATPDVFYFGNAVGESGNVQGDFSVSITDELLARNNPVSINPGATITNRYDYNRDGTVSVVDQLLARNNITTNATRLRQITVPIALQGSQLTAQGFNHGGSTESPGHQPSMRILAIDAALGLQKQLTGVDQEAVVSASISQRARRTVATAELDDELLELITTSRPTPGGE